MTTTHHRGIATLGGHPRPVHIWSWVTGEQIEKVAGGPVDIAYWVRAGWDLALAADYWDTSPEWQPPETVPAEMALDILLYIPSAAAGGGLACVAHLYPEYGGESTPVGATEVAEALGVQYDTVMKWRARGVMPAADWVVGGRPAWEWSTIAQWARDTGRLT